MDSLDSNNISSELQEVEDKIENILVDMEAACKEFLTSTDKFVSEWYLSSVKRGLTENAKTALKMGNNGLKKIKDELNELIASLTSLIESDVNTNNWPHRGKLPEGFNRKFGVSIVKDLRNDYLHSYIQNLLGHVGGFSIKYGLADSNWDMKPGYELPTYRIPVIWSEDMEKALKKYAEICDKWINLAIEMQGIEKQKSEAEITDLWDKL